VATREYRHQPRELRFDMFDREYTHQGELCTFEVLLARFEITDAALRPIAEIVHDLAIEMIGDHIDVFYDGRKVIDAHDSTFAQAGKFGVWTKADSIIQFDDLIATAK